MAGSLTNFCEIKVLDHVFGRSSFTMPTVYAALWTATLSDTSTGVTAGEAAYTGYARVAISGSVAAAASGAIASNADLTFPACTASSSVVTSVALCDAPTGGNMLVYDNLASSLTIDTQHTPPVIPSGQASLTLD